MTSRSQAVQSMSKNVFILKMGGPHFYERVTNFPKNGNNIIIMKIRTWVNAIFMEKWGLGFPNLMGPHRILLISG